MGVALSKRDPLGPIVEVDEMGIGGRDEGGKRGLGSEKKVWVVGAVEAVGGRCGRARFQVLENQTSDEYRPFLKRVLDAGAVVKCDWTKAHLALYPDFAIDPRSMSEDEEEESERRARRKGGEKDAKKRVQEYLPNFHRVTSLIKRVVISAHQGSIGRHLQLYLDEYCFRFDGRNRGELFGLVQDLVHSAARSKCVPYWRSCGRKTPDEPTYRQSRVFKPLAQKGGR